MASERSAIVKNADMSEDMQQDAVDTAVQAMEKFSIEREVSRSAIFARHSAPSLAPFTTPAPANGDAWRFNPIKPVRLPVRRCSGYHGSSR
jgi:hypothetical protein